MARATGCGKGKSVLLLLLLLAAASASTQATDSVSSNRPSIPSQYTSPISSAYSTQFEQLDLKHSASTAGRSLLQISSTSWWDSVLNTIWPFGSTPAPAPPPPPAPKASPPSLKTPSPAPKPSPAAAPSPSLKTPIKPPSPSPKPQPGQPSPSPQISPVPPSPSPKPKNITLPAEPVTVIPGEVLPEVLQKEQQNNGTDAFVLITDTVTVNMVLRGVSPLNVDSTLDSITAVTATLSGTSSDKWKLTNTTLSISAQATATALSGRRLLQQQQQQQDITVTLSILTANPRLVVFRLTQPLLRAATGAAAAAAAAAAASVQGYCSTEYCTRLAAAGIPVDSSSIQISPRFEFGSSSADLAAATAARDAALARSRSLGLTIGLSVAGGVVLLILLCNARRLIARLSACWNSRSAGREAEPTDLKAQSSKDPRIKSDAAGAADEVGRPDRSMWRRVLACFRPMQWSKKQDVHMVPRAVAAVTVAGSAAAAAAVDGGGYGSTLAPDAHSKKIQHFLQQQQQQQCIKHGDQTYCESYYVDEPVDIVLSSSSSGVGGSSSSSSSNSFLSSISYTSNTSDQDQRLGQSPAAAAAAAAAAEESVIAPQHDA